MNWSEKTIEAVAVAIFEGLLWNGAWRKANEVEKGIAIHQAKAALAAVAESDEWKEINELHDLAKGLLRIIEGYRKETNRLKEALRILSRAELPDRTVNILPVMVLAEESTGKE